MGPRQPARFQLLYGSPVPGYSAPAETIEPATAVVVAMLAPVVDAAATAHDTPALLARAVGAWSELIGLLVLELGGHFVGGFEPADALFDAALFDAAVRDQAERLGLAAAPVSGQVPAPGEP